MMSKDSEALYEFAHWLSEKGREAREELVYKQYTPWIDDVALGRLEAYEAYKHCREMLGNADSIFSPKFDKETMRLREYPVTGVPVEELNDYIDEMANGMNLLSKQRLFARDIMTGAKAATAACIRGLEKIIRKHEARS